MEPARPLREVFAELAGTGSTGDPGGLLRDLPDDLVAEAVVSYAETAPVEIAEHLAPFVSAHSAVGSESPSPEGWLDLLATAPVPVDAADEPDLGFGTGAEPDDLPELADLDAVEETADEETAVEDTAVEEAAVEEAADLGEAEEIEGWDEFAADEPDSAEAWPEIDDDLLD
jgi:hypothetical protein